MTAKPSEKVNSILIEATFLQRCPKPNQYQLPNQVQLSLRAPNIESLAEVGPHPWV